MELSPLNALKSGFKRVPFQKFIETEFLGEMKRNFQNVYFWLRSKISGLDGTQVTLLQSSADVLQPLLTQTIICPSSIETLQNQTWLGKSTQVTASIYGPTNKSTLLLAWLCQAMFVFAKFKAQKANSGLCQ